MSTEQYKIKAYSPKFAKKTVTVMRKVSQRTFGNLGTDNFDDQVNHFKNVLAKKYEMRIVTSFNERVIYGVTIFNDHQLIELLVDPVKKGLGISNELLDIVKNQSSGNLSCETKSRQLGTFLQQNGFEMTTANKFVWHEN
ncbi:Hypothetical protein ADU72_2145 [Pediococcus damnosus]|uniref:N-acetyltransferase domain-containing protein n=1 Tax=Pediococcus damnosus TaxID=51663 RepID=A0A0R2HQC6_9LACO|nr:hypothetical protein [Pediococcus damnosus]AMV61552.1 Hypothetical protein ADU69_1905 [Pediococcus damnosus]AMV62083.1 Hypothetical protein ADU70_0583 [Pediococcus damnosus]AMV65915.1 Hypothetical protein ADU71_2029 [Pediococcus damnosus]AMV68066.1 Hypothetical protein ADU72_2145 [Pediococcus damnosus]AMV70250.1 Hypothetical protein ADU73_1862 [Pediococcus damnosus]